MSSIIFPHFGDNCAVDQSTIDVDKLITRCGDATLEWSGWPDTCVDSPQGYHVWRTEVQPTNTAVSLCIGVDDKKRLIDGSTYNNALYYSTNKSPSNVLYSSLTPWGIKATSNSIVFNRNVKDVITTGSSWQLNLNSEDFTIEMWIGRNGESWYYNFPCETIISCYNSNNSTKFWRIFFEPRHVTQSVTTAVPDRPGTLAGVPYEQVGSNQGSLVFEFNENGDGSGGSVSRTIMNTTSNPSPNYSYSGGSLRYGYSHLCVTRKGNVLTCYVDGVVRATATINFSMNQTQPSSITIGRHWGESNRIPAERYTPYYGLTGSHAFPTPDGDSSHFHGTLHDIRVIKSIALDPPLGGRDDGVCSSTVWYETFKKIAGLPPTITQYTDTKTPLDVGVYYRVSSVQCGKDIFCECPYYIKIVKQSSQSFLGQAVNTADDLRAALDVQPPTLLSVFNEWYRGNPQSNIWLAPGSFTGSHTAWYYDTNLGSFVMPNNIGERLCLVAPQERWMKNYTHQAITQSFDGDDDTIGLVAAWSYYNGQHYAILAERTFGGVPPQSTNWHVRFVTLGSNQVLHSQVVGSFSGGWSGRTAYIRADRSGTKLTLSTGPALGSDKITRDEHTIESTSEYTIDFLESPPPPGLSNWDPFINRTGYGFIAYSQGQSFYRDWYLYPNPDMRIFDFSNGAPGVVWDWNPGTNKWIRNSQTAWEIAGKTASVITDLNTGKEFTFDCGGLLTT